MRRTSSKIVSFVLAILAAVTAMAEEGDPALVLHRLPEGPATTLEAVLERRAAVIVFWRSDCAPCLDELRELAALRRAAGSTRLLLIGLEQPDRLSAALERLRVQPQDAWYTHADPAAVLTAFGGYPPRLPLSVMLDRRGHVCARRIGTLGPALVTEWRGACDSQFSTGAD